MAEKNATTPGSEPGHRDSNADDLMVSRDLAIAKTAHRQGDLATAQQGYSRVLMASPKSVEALRGLGLLAGQRGDYRQSEQLLSAAIRLAPDWAALHDDLGMLLLETGELKPATHAFNEATALAPASGAFHVHLAQSFLEAGRVEEARGALEEAVLVDPGLAEAQWALARLHLLLGDFLKGWRAYRWGYEAGARRWRAPPLPEYAGRADPNSTVVVWADGSLSDQIMFARLLPRLAERVKRAVVMVDPRLVSFIAEAFPEVIAMAPLEPLDLRRIVPDATDQLAISDLPRILLPDIASLKDQGAYLQADRFKRMEARRRYRAQPDERLVGLLWRHGPTSGDIPGDKPSPALDLEDLGPLFTHQRLRFVSFQGDAGDEELNAAKRHFGIEIVGQSHESPKRQLEEIAPGLAAMDLVIAVDSPVAHMAGALGIETHLLLSSVPDWRWGLHGGTTPWYGSMRLYRQANKNDWRAPIRRLASTIAG